MCGCRLREFKKAAPLNASRSHAFYRFFLFLSCFSFPFLLSSFFLLSPPSSRLSLFSFLFLFSSFLYGLPGGPETSGQDRSKRSAAAATKGTEREKERERVQSEEKRNILEWRETRIVSFFATFVLTPVDKLISHSTRYRVLRDFFHSLAALSFKRLFLPKGTDLLCHSWQLQAAFVSVHDFSVE